MKNLRTDDTIVILPADKGNATVVMNRRDYDGKIETMLEAICIKETRENNNLDCGLNVNQVWSPLLH